MPASCGVRPPFIRLQRAQAVTMFSQVVRPPRERGVTWSKVRSSPEPQYWQEKPSRRKRLNRVKAGGRSWATYCLSDTTLGSFISYAVFCLKKKKMETTSTRSRKTALMTSCQGQRESG